jgi:phage protein D
MGLLVPLDEKRTFYAPQFKIVLKGQAIDPLVLRDVQEVSYTDDSANLDAFEFTLGDWDPVQNRPKYSSPWNADGTPYKVEGQPVPNFEPGADLELHLGYQGDDELTLMLKGEVVSITPNFPAAGSPVVRVRALNYLYKLQRARVTGTFEGKPLEIARDIALQAGVSSVKMPPGGAEGESRRDVLTNVVAFEEIHRRAKEASLAVRLEDDAGQATLFFDPPVGSDPVASLAWGLNLISFSPQLSARGGVEKVIVRNVDPAQSGNAQRFQGEATWSDIPDLDPSALGPKGLDEIQNAFRGNIEEVTDAEARSEEAARTMALDRLKGTGSTIGDPRLRAGAVIEIAGLGPRFSGKYKLTQTTHAIGGSGYTTTFQAAKVVLT